MFLSEETIYFSIVCSRQSADFILIAYIELTLINFIQVTAGYRFGLGNAVKSFPDRSDAVMRTNGWNLSVSLLFDF